MENLIKEDYGYEIKGFMVTKMALKGTELGVYAIIYSFYRNGRVCECSRSYMSQFTNSSIRSVQTALNNLVKKSYIQKHTEITKNGIKNTYLPLITMGVKKLHTTGEEIAQPSEKIAPNKKENKLNNNINTNIDKGHTKIELSSYLIQDFSEITRETYFAEMSIFLLDNECIVSLPHHTIEMINKKGNEQFKILMERQLKFYNVQFKTDYELSIKESA